MSEVVRRLASVWRQTARRSLAQWKLLSSVVLGVLLASAVMAGTVVYFDALRELALDRTLQEQPAFETNILLWTSRAPANDWEYQRVVSAIDGQIDRNLAWITEDRMYGVRGMTFFPVAPGEEELAGEDNSRAYFVHLPRLPEHATVMDGGRLPAEPEAGTAEGPLSLEVLIPLKAANRFGLVVGDTVVAVPPQSARASSVTVKIVGILESNDPTDAFWQLDLSLRPIADDSDFQNLPMYVSRKAITDVLGPSAPSIAAEYVWLLEVDTGRIDAGNAETVLASLSAMGRLATSLEDFRLTTGLDEALIEYDRRLFFTKLPMFVVLILIVVVILYYLVTLSALVTDERRGELALLRSRGASPAQLLTVFVIEGTTIAVLATLAGPFLAATGIGLLGYTPAFSDLTNNANLSVGISAEAYLLSAAGGLLSFAAMIIPAIQASRVGVTQHRQQSARPSALPAFQRYYADVLLLLLGIVMFRQLSQQDSVIATDLLGQATTDNLLLALPGVILVAAGMVLLRLFPVIMKVVSRIVSPRLSAGLVMGVWQMTRNPTHYARLSLLMILTAGLGIFASNFGATLSRSFDERVKYSTGADMRIEGVRPETPPRPSSSQLRAGTPTPIPFPRPELAASYNGLEGVTAVSPVLRTRGHDSTRVATGAFMMLAVNRGSFGDVAWYRDDFSRQSVAGVLALLDGSAGPDGVVLPADAATLRVRVRPNDAYPSIRVDARVRDAMGQYWTHRLGTLESDEWAMLEASLDFDGKRPMVARGPLTLVALQIYRPSRRGFRRSSLIAGGSVLIDEISVTRTSGDTQVVEQFDDISGWQVLRPSSDVIFDVLRASESAFDGGSGSALFSWAEGRQLGARGIFYSPVDAPMPVLANASFLDQTGHKVQDEFNVSAAGHLFSVRLVGTIDLFPTMTDLDESYLIADVDAVTGQANAAAIEQEVVPNEMWVSTSINGGDRQALRLGLESVAGYHSGSIQDRAITLSESQGDPLVKAGWRALLFIAFGAVLLLSCTGFLLHAYVSFQNRQFQFALLRTIGFSMRQLLTMVWLEQTIVVAVGLALGTWMGARLGSTILPFLGHDDTGGKIVPPFVMEVDWSALLLTYFAILAVFATITLGLVWLIHRISVQRILRLGEM